MRLRKLTLSGIGQVTRLETTPFPAFRAGDDAIIIPFVGGLPAAQKIIVISAGSTELYNGDSADQAANAAADHVREMVLRQLADEDGSGGVDRLAIMRRLSAALTERLRASGAQCMVIGGSDDSTLNIQSYVRPLPDGSFSLHRDGDGKFILTPDPDSTDDALLVMELDASEGDLLLEGISPDQIIAEGNVEHPETGETVQVVFVRIPSGSGFLIKRPEGSTLEGNVIQVSWDGNLAGIKAYNAAEWAVYLKHFQAQAATPPPVADPADSAPSPSAGSDQT